MGHDVLRDLLLVLEHRSLKYGAGQCLPASRARDCICHEHFRHPRFGRRATNMHVAFLFVSGIIFASGLAWLIGAKYLPADTAAVETAGNN